MPKTDLLLTGATGFIGGELLPRLLRSHPRASVHCLVRARGPRKLAERRTRLLEWGGIGAADAARVVVHAGDVTQPDLGLGAERSALAARIDEVFHAAASTRFDLAIEETRRQNVEGTRHVIAFAAEARDAGGLRRLHHVSTAYVEPDASGQHRNAYEQSKWEAERALKGSRVPFTCYRPSIVMGDSRTGRTPHFRVLYEPIRWVAMGQLTALPVRPEIRLDVVPVDYVCDALVAIAARDDSLGRTYRLTAGPERSISIRELVELTAQIGNAGLREIGREPVTVPEIVSPDQIELAAGEERERLEKLFEVTAQVLRGYAPYALEELLFESPETRDALAGTGIECPSLRDYLRALLLYARDQWYE